MLTIDVLFFFLKSHSTHTATPPPTNQPASHPLIDTLIVLSPGLSGEHARVDYNLGNVQSRRRDEYVSFSRCVVSAHRDKKKKETFQISVTRTYFSP